MCTARHIYLWKECVVIQIFKKKWVCEHVNMQINQFMELCIISRYIAVAENVSTFSFCFMDNNTVTCSEHCVRNN